MSRYWGTNAAAPSPIVERLNGDYVSDLLSSSWSLSSEIYKYTVSFDVRDIGVNLGDSFEIFWATASCANDIIEGTINTPVPVPEPATMLLLGTGLIGMAGIGRKKFKK